MKRIAFFLLTVITVAMTLSLAVTAADYSTAQAPFATEITLDGGKDDGYGADFAVGTAADTVRGTANFCHDGTYLYVYVNVTDTTVAPARADKSQIVGGSGGAGFADLRCNDGVTVGINLGTTDQTNTVVSGITGPAAAESSLWSAERGMNSSAGRYYAGRHAFAPAGADWNDDNNNPLNFYYYAYTSVETETGYAVELRIPFGKDINGVKNDVKALSETGFSVFVQLTESVIDDSYQTGDQAPFGIFVSSNKAIDTGLALWGSMLRSYQTGWDKIEIAEPDTVVKEIRFDNLSAFTDEIDFYTSSYSGDHVKLSAAHDHTTGSGKSLEMTNRNVPYARVNLLNMFNDEQRGKAFRVTAWVYVPEEGAEIRLSSYTPFSYGIENTSVYCPADTWTKLTFIHEHTDVEVTQVGIAQLPGKVVAPIFYIDDITITDITPIVNMPEIEVQVRLDGEIVKYDDVKPQIEGSAVLLPMTETLEKLHCVVERNQDRITATKGEKTIELAVGSGDAYVNGAPAWLELPISTVGDTVMVPASFLAEALGVEVGWQSSARILDITSEEKDEVSIYRDHVKQEIYGFGASIDCSAYRLMNMENKEMQQEILDSLFSDTGKGAAFTLMRWTIYPKTAEASAGDGGKDGIKATINPAEDVWDYENYDNQRWMADKALSYNPDISFVASTWSPPAWMKVNGTTVGQTELANKLAKEHYDDYAEYLARWTDKYKNDYGYNIRYMSIQNEPYLDAWYDACLWTSNELAQVADILVDKYAAMGLADVLVGAAEGASIQESYGIMNIVQDSKVGFVPTHSYVANYSPAQFDLTEYGLPIIQTEYNLGPKMTKQYVIGEGLTAASLIADCLNNGYNGFLYWYAQRNIPGAERPHNGEALIDYNEDTIWYGKEFFVMAQFSRFFRPGDHIVVSYSENKDVEIVSSVNGETGKVSTIVINHSGNPVTMKVNGLVGNLNVYVTDSVKEFEKVTSVTADELDSYTFGSESVTLLTENITEVPGAVTAPQETCYQYSPVTVKLRFPAAVEVTGVPTVTTNCGSFSYIGGSGTDELSFGGFITAETADTLNLTALTVGSDSTITDADGNRYLSAVLNLSDDISVVSAKPASGTGDAAAPYRITTAEELYWFAGLVNGTLTGEARNSAACALLARDICLNNGVFDADGAYRANDGMPVRVWTPIGNSDHPFSGNLGGNGHTVSGLYVPETTASDAGLFGCADGGSLENIVIADACLPGDGSVGGVCGSCRGNTRIANCVNTGAGGVYGSKAAEAVITNCYYLSDRETDSDDGTTAVTATQLASGKVAFLLNTAGGEGESSGVFGQGTRAPVSADETHPAVSERLILAGDINDDWKVTVADVTLLARRLAGGYQDTVLTERLDVSGDGKLTVVDLVSFRRYLAGGYGVVLH